MVKNKNVFISDGHTFTVDGKTYKVNDLFGMFQDRNPISMKMSEFLDDAEGNSWFEENQDVTMKDIIPHIERVRDADISRPIYVLETGNIIDGWHRYFKHILLYRKQIKVIVIVYSDLDKLKHIKK